MTMTATPPTVNALIVDANGNPVGVTAGALNTGGGGGGGGGAATIADGADAAQGTTTDAASANTVVGLLKNLKAALAASLNVSSTPVPATTATLTHTASSAANVASLVALNAARLGLIIVNNSSATLYLKYGATASTTSLTYIIPAGATWEMPATPRYTGRIDGIWSAANGFAEITELSA